MINYPAVQMLPRYFEKKLVWATALIYCGTPFGSLTVPYLIISAVNAYGVSGSFYIVSGVLMNIFVAAVLLRPVVLPKNTSNIAIEIEEPHIDSDNICDDEKLKPVIEEPIENDHPTESENSAPLCTASLLMPQTSTSSYLTIPGSQQKLRHRIKKQISTTSTVSMESQVAMENLAVSFAIMDNVSMASVPNVAAINRQFSHIPFNHMKSKISTVNRSKSIAVCNSMSNSFLNELT